MKNNLILISILISLSFNASSQKLEWLNKNTNNDKNYSPEVLNTDKDGIYTYSYYNGIYTIEKHDLTGKQIFSTEVDLPDIKGKKIDIENLTYMNGYFYVFISYFDKNKDKAVFIVSKNSSSTGKHVKTIDNILEVPVEKARRMGRFYIMLSYDKTKILINHFAYYKQENILKDKYRLFDSDLNLLIEKDEKISVNEQNYKTFDYLIDNDGSIYYLKSYNDNETFVVSYDANKDYEKWEEKIELKDLNRNDFLNSICLKINSKNDLIISGYVNNKETKKKEIINKLIGYFFIKIDNKTKETKISKFQNFSDNTLTEFAKNNEGYPVSRIIRKDDGGILMITEYYKYYEVCSKNGCTYHHQFNGIQILNLSFNGDLLWKKTIRKKQYCAYGNIDLGGYRFNKKYMSYATGLQNNYLYILFNDNKKNIDKKEDEKLKLFIQAKKSYPLVCAIDMSNGNMSKNNLYNPKEKKMYLMTETYSQEKENAPIYLVGRRKGKYAFAIFK